MSKTYNDIPISKVLRSITDSKRWSVTNDFDIETIEWQDPELTMPSVEYINAEREKIAQNFNDNEYQDLRKNGKFILEQTSDGGTKWQKVDSGYPPIEEQLDYIYHYGIDAWKKDIIDPVKSKYPKPEGIK